MVKPSPGKGMYPTPYVQSLELPNGVQLSFLPPNKQVSASEEGQEPSADEVPVRDGNPNENHGENTMAPSKTESKR
jgi:hypothetical protein